MQEYIITKGDTSKIITVSIYDSSSTTGAKLAGLVFNSAGLTAYYNRAGAAGAATVITLVTATKGTWVSSGFIAIDGTNMPGDYELHIPDAVIASGVDEVDIQLKGAANMVPVNIKIHLIAQDLQIASVAQTGDNYARIGAPAGASVSADVAAVKVDTAAALIDTNELQGDWTDGGRLDLIIDEILLRTGNISTVGAANNVPAESYVLTTGTQSANLFTDTAPLDETRHTHTDTAGVLDLYYQFDIGASGNPSSITVTGYLNGGNDTLQISAYNWVTSLWTVIGTWIGTGVATNTTESYALYNYHVGTAANLGKVRIRFDDGPYTLTTAVLAIDQLYVTYAAVPISLQTVGLISDVTPTVSGFDTDLTQADALWDNALLAFTSGTLVGLSRPILTYLNASGAITFDEDLPSAPANGDAFVISHDHVHPITEIQAGLATTANLEARTPTAAQLADIIANSTLAVPVTFTSGTTTTAVLALVDGSAASATNDQYKGRLLAFNSGTLDEVVTDITGYVGATKTATITAVPTAVTSGHTARLV